MAREMEMYNIGISIQTVRQYQAESGKSDDEMIRILDTLDEINNALNNGRITKRILSLIDKSVNSTKSKKMI
jgi:hypothetical protein